MSRGFTESDVPDLTGKVIIVTGANAGIGFEAARAFAEHGADVVMACRNPDKAQAARQRIQANNPSGDVITLPLDLASLDSVRTFVAAYGERYDRLDLLVNNAGVMIPPLGRTEQGFELQFGVNHLGHFALTGLLLPLIQKTPGARVVNVSSTAHRMGRMDFDDLNWERRDYSAGAAYGQSKLANLHFTFELNRRLKDAGIDAMATAAHPGWAATDLQRHSGVIQFMNNFFAQSQDKGAWPTLMAALDDNAKGGEYYGPSGFMEMWGPASQAFIADHARIPADAQRLWDVSESMTGVQYLSH
ncbi:MAG: oxidoreductase [Myxococcota bacterium]